MKLDDDDLTRLLGASPEGADEICDLQEATGVEFTSTDLTDREHRIRFYFFPDGKIEVVTVEGAKCEDPGDPTEVHCLAPNQADYIVALAVRAGRVNDAVAAAAKSLAEEGTDPVRVAISVLAATLAVDPSELLEEYYEMRKIREQ